MIVLLLAGCASRIFVEQRMECDGSTLVQVSDPSVTVRWNVFGGRSPFLDPDVRADDSCFLDARGDDREPWLTHEPWPVPGEPAPEEDSAASGPTVHVAEVSALDVYGDQALQMTFDFGTPGPVALHTDFLRLVGSGDGRGGWLSVDPPAGELAVVCPSCAVELDLRPRFRFGRTEEVAFRVEALHTASTTLCVDGSLDDVVSAFPTGDWSGRLHVWTPTGSGWSLHPGGAFTVPWSPLPGPGPDWCQL